MSHSLLYLKKRLLLLLLSLVSLLVISHPIHISSGSTNMNRNRRKNSTTHLKIKCKIDKLYGGGCMQLCKILWIVLFVRMTNIEKSIKTPEVDYGAIFFFVVFHIKKIVWLLFRDSFFYSNILRNIKRIKDLITCINDEG